MEEEINIDANEEIPSTHFFVYKEKQYPFNFDLFKIFSQYFISDLPKEEKIDLFDESLNISESSIPDFINFCQARKITLTKENASTLHKLSQKFKVPSLLNKTKRFIAAHQKEVVVEIMSIYQNDDDFNLEEYEEIISNDLIKYIKDDHLLSLQIPILHRILTKYLLKIKNQSNSKNSEQPPELIEFLFKCLDHYGREASVLFDQIDSFASSGILIKRLLDGYSEKFDFRFVNISSIKTVYQLENEIIAREKEMNQQNSKSQQEVMCISKHVSEQIELMRKQRQDELNDKKEMFMMIPKMVAQEIERLKKQYEDEMKKKEEMLRKQHEEDLKMKNEMISSMLKQFEAIQAKYHEDLQKQRDDFDEKMRKINEQLEKLNHMKISRLFPGESVGLISILGDDVTIPDETDNMNDTSILKKYDNNSIANYRRYRPRCESDSIIKFDFGSQRKIDLHSYLIRTSSQGPNGDHPKSWRIEGSNDGQSWKKLDSRSNDDNLNGQYKQWNYVCQFSKYGSENNLFRYIRYVQEDSWNSDKSRKYVFYLTYFELYGDAVTI